MWWLPSYRRYTEENWVVYVRVKNDDNSERTIGEEQLQIYNLFMMTEWKLI